MALINAPELPICRSSCQLLLIIELYLLAYEKSILRDKLDSVTSLEQTALQLQPSIQAFSGSKGNQTLIN